MTKFGFGTTSILDSFNKLHQNTALVQQMKEEDEKDVQLKYCYIYFYLRKNSVFVGHFPADRFLATCVFIL